ncbi:hypothetical protein ACFWNQ_10260 [Streptomyces virginiae]
MATEGFAAVRGKVSRTLAENNDHRARLDSQLNDLRELVAHGNRAEAEAGLRALLLAHADAHPDEASNNFAHLLGALPRETVGGDRVTNAGIASNSIIADGNASVRAENAVLGDHNIVGRKVSVRNIDRHRVDNRNVDRRKVDNRVTNQVSAHGRGEKSWVWTALGAVGVIIVILIIVHGDRDEGTSVRTCGDWLRLDPVQMEEVARNRALDLGNGRAAADVWIVQNTQTDCGGNSDRKLDDVLAPAPKTAP